MTASTAYNNVLSAAEVSSVSAEKQKLSCLKTMLPSAAVSSPTVSSKEKLELHELLQNEPNQGREPNQAPRIDKHSDADAVRDIETYFIEYEEWTQHKLLQNGSTVTPHEVQTVIDKYPGSVRKIDDDGWLPLHTAVMRKASVEVIRVLLKANPSAAKKTAEVTPWRGKYIATAHCHNEKRRPSGHSKGAA